MSSSIPMLELPVVTTEIVVTSTEIVVTSISRSTVGMLIFCYLDDSIDAIVACKVYIATITNSSSIIC